jgi:microcystin-dependent protein
MVADTFSATLGLLLMGTGNDNNTWGTNCNSSVFQITEDAIANQQVYTNTSGTLDLSTSPPPAGPSAARWWQLKFTGSLAANLTLKVPNLTKEWIINNACTLNGFSLLMQTPSGSPVTIPLGYQKVFCDGSNNIVVSPYNSNQVLMPNGAAAAPVHSFNSEQNSGWYRFGTQDIRISVGGVDIMRVTGAGAGAPNLVDILSGNSLAFAGVTFNPGATVPTGAEFSFPGVTAPAGYYMCFGQTANRITDAALFTALTLVTTGNTHTSTTIDNLPSDLRNLGLEGALVEGTGLSTGTTIVSINSATSMTIAPAASSTLVGISLRILPWGQGDASTTFNIPDRRGAIIAGRDNMGGTAKGLLTLAQAQGILGTKLNATGGEQGHTDTITEMPNHNHPLTDPGHNHTIEGVTSTYFAGSTPNPNSIPGGSTNTGTSTTGITLSPTGGGAAHNNVQPTTISNWIIKR